MQRNPQLHDVLSDWLQAGVKSATDKKRRLAAQQAAAGAAADPGAPAAAPPQPPAREQARPVVRVLGFETAADDQSVKA